jgi:HAD superfamily hydrolase (TIGR01509 family)
MDSRADLVIFDCDGVLVDSEPIAARIGAAVLTDLGWKVTPEELIHRFAGCTDDDWRAGVEAELGRSLEEGWEEPYQAWYDDAFTAELKAVPGAAAAIEAIAALGLKYCVASNGSHAKIASNLGRVGLAEAFEGRRFSAQDVDQGKPAPDLFLHAAAAMRVPPERCVVVEDTPTGLAAARSAGMRAIAYVSGLIPSDRLAGPATTLVHDLADLPVLIGVAPADEVHRELQALVDRRALARSGAFGRAPFARRRSDRRLP